jgi:CheY-like chemotaxis protein
MAKRPCQRILVLQDGNDLADLLRGQASALQGDIDVLSVRTAAEGAQRAETDGAFAVAVVDSAVGGEDSLRVAERLRHVRLFRHLPLLLLTDEALVGDPVFRGCSHAPVETLTLPLSPDDFVGKVRHLLL